MTNEEKIMKFRQLLSNINVTDSYEVLEETGDLKTNYWDYMTTEPINCNEELKRLEHADYDLCSALLTMLLREDHFVMVLLIREWNPGRLNVLFSG